MTTISPSLLHYTIHLVGGKHPGTSWFAAKVQHNNSYLKATPEQTSTNMIRLRTLLRTC